jgi:hypothetical protein
MSQRCCIEDEIETFKGFLGGQVQNLGAPLLAKMPALEAGRLVANFAEQLACLAT